MEQIVEEPLFGGAITCSLPSRFQTVSKFRDVPDNQEVFSDPSRDESIIFELLELKQDVPDEQSGAWFFQDLASEQSSQQQELEIVNQLAATDVPFIDPSVFKAAAVGKMAVSKGRQGMEAANLVKVYLANLRLRNVNTDVLITVYEPLFISALSESAASVGAGFSTPAAASGRLSAADIFQLVVKTFKVNDWSLFVN